MRSDLVMLESESFDKWIRGLENDATQVTVETTEELGDIILEDSVRQLQHLKRQGKLPVNRGVHMYQDVKKTYSKKLKRVTIGGGKKTGTLWHIVNDGAYRTRATHFIDAVLKNADSKVDEIQDRKAKEHGFD